MPDCQFLQQSSLGRIPLNELIKKLKNKGFIEIKISNETVSICLCIFRKHVSDKFGTSVFSMSKVLSKIFGSSDGDIGSTDVPGLEVRTAILDSP